MTVDDRDSKGKPGKRPGDDKPASATSREPTGMSRRFATVEEPVTPVVKPPSAKAAVDSGAQKAGKGKDKKG